MRNISQAGLAKLASRYGNEPITIIEVDWVDGSTAVYADRTIGDIPGRIVEVSDLDNAVNVNGNGSDGQSTGGSTASQELAVTLDDTDGSIKAIFDSQDVHKRPARVYQYFSGLDLADKFLLFSGKINTPVSWSERDRTIKFTILSQLEDLEIGFSAEEGQFPYLPSELVGKTWPMVFGTAVNYQALQINKAVKGTTLAGVGVLSGMDLWSALPDGADDGQFKLSLLMMLIQINHLKKVKECWAPSFHPPVDAKKAASLQKQIDSLQSQVNQAVAKQAQQVACTLARRNLQINDANANGLGANPVRILGGEDFPQNQTITINVNDALFTGHFEADLFYIDSRVHPTDDATAAAAAASKTTEPAVCLTPTQVSYYRYEDEVPNGCGDGFPAGNKILDMGVTITNSNATVSEMDTTPIVQQFWADAGTEVTLAIDAPITYIASIVPGTVLAVRAYKQLIGQRRLVDVPTDLYTIKTQTYGSVTAVEIVVNFPLSARKDEGWTDDLYITFQSDIGPDVVEILKHLITHYTNLDWDEESFDHAQEKLQAFPANFPLLEQKNAVQLLQEIAFQARCALWISDGAFYLKYLPEEPTPADTITISDIDADSGIEVELTATEDLVTKMKIKWRLSWTAVSDRPEDTNEQTIILRHNVAKYGLQEQDYDFYIYNQPDIVYKCATFWMIRNSITWKRIKFKTFLNKLNLETFDAVMLDFASPYVANGPVLAVVEKASYSSADNLVDFQCLVPVAAGTMEKYKFYWPSALPTTDTWPPQSDIDASLAGGGGIGTDATGNLPVGDTSTIPAGDVVFVGGPNVVFRGQSDWGDRTPTDVGFTPQSVVNPATYIDLSPGSRPYLDLRTYPRRSLPAITPIPPAASQITIDLNKTQILDTSDPANTKIAYLSSILQGITKDSDNPDSTNGKLTISRAALVADSDNPAGRPLTDVLKFGTTYLCIRSDVSIWDKTAGDHQFDFQYDATGQKFGAGTAFLQG
jgi:hypothetical protein